MVDPRKALGMEMSPPRLQAHFFFLKQDCMIDDEVDRAQTTHGPRFLDMADESTRSAVSASIPAKSSKFQYPVGVMPISFAEWHAELTPRALLETSPDRTVPR